MYKKEFGQRVRKFRVRLNYSYADLADYSGLSESHIRNLENGNRAPTLQSLTKLSNALHIPTECLLFDIEPDNLVQYDNQFADYRSMNDRQLNLFMCIMETLYLKKSKTEECLVGTRIRNLRLANHLSQKELAHTLGVSTPHIANLENGNVPISIPTIQKICKTFNIRISQIVCDVSHFDKYLEFDRMISECKKILDPDSFNYLEGIYKYIINNF